jgi:hypothetical protein
MEQRALQTVALAQSSRLSCAGRGKPGVPLKPRQRATGLLAKGARNRSGLYS